MCAFSVFQTIAGTRIDHGGTSRSVPNLCDALAETGVTVRLITGKPFDPLVVCNYPSPEAPVHLVQESNVHRQWGMKKRFARVLEKCLTEDQNVTSLQIVHDHGLWLASNRAVARATRLRKISRVVSPRGMLSDWAMSNARLKKQIAWSLFQRRDLMTASGFHATGEQEAEDLRALGFKQPIAIIPNGVVMPDDMPEKIYPDNQKRMLFLSRIHPKKGLLNLLRAWHQVSTSGNWKLVLAGPDENGHRREVESLATKLGVRDQLEFVGPVNDNEKWKLYRSAEVFVLPSFSENFGIVIAEALAAGLPVITTTQTPWRSLLDNEIGWWVEPTVGGIANALRDAFGQSDTERVDAGRRATEWATQRFAWSSIARQMSSYYMWLLGKADRPEFVICGEKDKARRSV